MTIQADPVLSFKLVDRNLYEVTVKVPVDHSDAISMVANSNLESPHSGKSHENEIERLLGFVTQIPGDKGKRIQFLPEEGKVSTIEYETSSEFKTRVEPTIDTKELFIRRGMVAERILWCISSWVASGECEDRKGHFDKRREVYKNLQSLTLKTFVRSVETN